MSAVFQAPSGAQKSTATSAPRNLAQIICTRLLKLPLTDIAEAIGCDVSGASRVRANERAVTVQGWLKLIDLCGYKLVSKGMKCIPEDELNMLRRSYWERHGFGDLDFGEPE